MKSSVRLYRLPIIWLAVAILIATLAGCIITVVLAQRYPDEPSSVDQETLLNMPLSRAGEIPRPRDSLANNLPRERGRWPSAMEN